MGLDKVFFGFLVVKEKNFTSVSEGLERNSRRHTPGAKVASFEPERGQRLKRVLKKSPCETRSVP
jgi:hypothetical protein